MTVSICFKRDCFVRTVTVWVVGLPSLVRTFDDKTHVTGYSLQPAEHNSGSQAVVAVAGPAMAKLVGGGRGTRYPCAWRSGGARLQAAGTECGYRVWVVLYCSAAVAAMPRQLVTL